MDVVERQRGSEFAPNPRDAARPEKLNHEPQGPRRHININVDTFVVEMSPDVRRRYFGRLKVAR